jgi:hypothetical protein
MALWPLLFIPGNRSLSSIGRRSREWEEPAKRETLASGEAAISEFRENTQAPRLRAKLKTSLNLDRTIPVVETRDVGSQIHD